LPYNLFWFSLGVKLQLLVLDCLPFFAWSFNSQSRFLRGQFALLPTWSNWTWGDWSFAFILSSYIPHGASLVAFRRGWMMLLISTLHIIRALWIVRFFMFSSQTVDHILIKIRSLGTRKHSIPLKIWFIKGGF